MLQQITSFRVCEVGVTCVASFIILHNLVACIMSSIYVVNNDKTSQYKTPTDYFFLLWIIGIPSYSISVEGTIRENFGDLCT